jgi:hypothetical protein
VPEVFLLGLAVRAEKKAATTPPARLRYHFFSIRM